MVDGRSLQSEPLPLLIDVDFDYERKSGVYIFTEYMNGEGVNFRDVERVLNEAKEKVLFPNVTPTLDQHTLYRRCDGLWLAFKDEVAEWLLSRICSVVMSGGYPPQLEYAYMMLVDQFKPVMGEDEAINRVGFALAQIYATGAVGEYKPSFFGYEEYGIDGEDEGVEENARSLYAGGLALWEVDVKRDVEIPHTLCSHAFRRLKSVADDDLTIQLDGRSVQNAVEYLCMHRGVKGCPHPARVDVGYEIAVLLESGKPVFVDEPPDPFPHV